MSQEEQRNPTFGEMLARYPHGVRDFSCMNQEEKRDFVRRGKALNTEGEQMDFLQQMFEEK